MYIDNKAKGKARQLLTSERTKGVAGGGII